MFKLNNKKQTPEEYAQKLKEALASSLRSVILFGSAASGEHVEGKSDYNLLVIVEKWGILELNQVTKVTQEWIKECNPPPLLFTPERLQASADCFPIEMLDMKQSYQGYIYAGGNPRKITELMAKTLSTSLVLFRAALRLFTDAVPAKKYEVLPAIAEKVKEVDVDAFTTIRKLKSGELKCSQVNPQNLFARYMTSIIAVGDAVDLPGAKI